MARELQEEFGSGFGENGILHILYSELVSNNEGFNCNN